jgi:nucleoside-diphosphate-sugar epimerase
MQNNVKTALVTGATGLLGNNLVRALVRDGWRVRALVRDPFKGHRQLDGLDVELVVGDMQAVAAFAPALKGTDVVFHPAAYFRDSYKGGTHREALHRINVSGTAELLRASHAAGVRRFVHTSSIATLIGRVGGLIDETMLRPEAAADDYYRSKILADREVLRFLDDQPDFWAALVLPGWMHGPGDQGPTSAGQMVVDFMHRRLPGIPPGGFSVVDARDVAAAMIAAAERGVRGRRYLAAGRPVEMAELLGELEKISGVKAPRRNLPLALLYGVAALSELKARLTGRPVLLSWATVRLIDRERGRNRYDHRRSGRELGLTFRPLAETLGDEIAWFRRQGWVPAARS